MLNLIHFKRFFQFPIRKKKGVSNVYKTFAFADSFGLSRGMLLYDHTSYMFQQWETINNRRDYSVTVGLLKHVCLE